MCVDVDVFRRRVSADPRDPRFFQNPYPAYDAMRAAGPAVFWEQYGFWCLTSNAAVDAALRDRRFGRPPPDGAPDMPDHLAPFAVLERRSLLELEGAVHGRLRRLVTRAFTSRRVEGLKPRVRAIIEERLNNFVDAQSADLIADFAEPIPVLVIAELIGAPADMAPQLREWSHRMTAMYHFAVTRDVEDRAATAARDFAAFARDLVAAKRKAPKDDLLSALAAEAGPEGRLDDDELVATCVLLLNAGHEATVHAIGNGVAALLETRTSPSFEGETAIASSIEELLRYDPPLHLFTRFAYEDVEIAGIRLKRGEKIGLLLGAAGRDPRRFPRPNALDFARGGEGHPAFGAGVHFCVGAPLARLEMRMALPALFARLRGLELASPPKRRNAYHFRGLESLQVRWVGASAN